MALEGLGTAVHRPHMPHQVLFACKCPGAEIAVEGVAARVLLQVTQQPIVLPEYSTAVLALEAMWWRTRRPVDQLPVFCEHNFVAAGKVALVTAEGAGVWTNWDKGPWPSFGHSLACHGNEFHIKSVDEAAICIQV